MPTLKTTDYNREGTKRLSTIRNIVCLNQLNQDVFNVLEECVLTISKIKNAIIYHRLDVSLCKLKSSNQMIIDKVSALTTDLNCKTCVKRILIEEKAAKKILSHDFFEFNI